jgi:HEAT repeat protein
VSSLDNLLNDLLSDNENLAEEAVTALAEKGADAIPPLLDLLNSPDVDRRWWGLTRSRRESGDREPLFHPLPF